MRNLIIKCLKELEQENPRIDYVRGILESISDMNDVSYSFSGGIVTSTGEFVPKHENVSKEEDNEAAFMDAKARAAMATIKELEGNGTITKE